MTPETKLRLAPVLSGVALLAGALSCGAGAPDRPSVVLYVTDTLRADALGCYGRAGDPTPALDALAAEGVLFERAFAPSSWTRASMASLLTGTEPGVHGAQDRDQALSAGSVLLSEVLKEAGYATCLVTTNPNIGRFFRFDQAFDEFVELYDRREAGKVRTKELVTTADVVTDRALAWIERAPRPFLLVVLSIDPHSPYEPPARFDRFGDPASSRADGTGPWINRDDLTPADRERIRSLYQGEVAFNDAEFGRLVAGLRERGLLDESVVVFTSDHGEEFWEHGTRGHGKTLSDEVLHVPLILRHPPRLAPGRRGELVRTLDVAPTILDLVGLAGGLPGGGRSLLEGGDEPVFSSLDLDGTRLVSLRTDRWRLVRDVESGERRLYDARGELAADEGAELEALSGQLEQRVSETRERRRALFGDAPVPTLDEGELPAEHVEELQNLGYLETDGDG